MSENGTTAQETATVAESMRFLLLQNIGNYVVVELWFGGGALHRRCGLLTSVGADYFLLEDEANGQQIAGALSDIRMVTFCRVLPAPAQDAEETRQTDESAEQEQRTLEQYSVTQAHARPHAQAAFNYAKRKTRKLD